MSCRTGCITKDHASYSECLRTAGTRVAYANSAGGQDYSAQKRLDRDLDSYRAARAEGLQPATTKPKDVEVARRASDATGVPFRADL